MKKRLIVGFVGLPHSGRRVVASRLVEQFGFTAVDFGDAIDAMLRVLGASNENLTGSKLHEAVPELGGRSFQYAKQALGYHFGRRMLWDDVWIPPWRRRLAAIPGHVVISDIRFPNEADAVRAAGGLIVRVDRPSRPVADNATSRILSGIRVDSVFVNTARDVAELITLVDAELGPVFGGQDALAVA